MNECTEKVIQTVEWTYAPEIAAVWFILGMIMLLWVLMMDPKGLEDTLRDGIWDTFLVFVILPWLMPITLPVFYDAFKREFWK